MTGFLLEVSGLKEIETFDFLVQFLKSPSRLFIGIYERNFPMISFMTFLFYKVLKIFDKKRYKELIESGVPNEMWLVKWFITLFAGYTTKPFLLRIWDFLMVEDFMGPVYVALTIVLLTKDSLFVNFEETLKLIQKPGPLCDCLEFRSFIKKLQSMEINIFLKKKLLTKYFTGLKGEEKKDFQEFYNRLSIYLEQAEIEDKKCKK